ncbi:alpha/beta hydrolase [Nonomuraea sp. 3-1Str]|uniref:alpha/beta hydrolase family protein n=1 Tax=Nonomuraea sp. 3-1Str TaxID=2929801 RepID=UPI0028664FAE|nr:alpha/beta hydrolase [Nonomuraea sp. 3-1Str]MDR8410103.1 alpha/beta hydrolase [Nonomuraea sp. 3-1Str]
MTVPPERRAAARDAAEQESAFSHPHAEPDVTVSYGRHPDQVVDLYAPRGGGGAGAPLIVVLHGGAWRAAYDRRHVSPFAAFLARRGFAVASVEYRRGGAGPGGAGGWPGTVDDVAAAMDALPGLVAGAMPRTDAQPSADAQPWADGVPSVDVSRIVVTGHSAGGHLALWAAARHVLPQGSPWRPPGAGLSVAGVVALAPIADLRTARELSVCSGAALQLLGGPERFEERRPSADPAALLPTGVPATVVHGRADIVVPVEVAGAYVRAAARAGEAVRLRLVEDAGHFPLIDPAAEACAVVAEEVTRLLDGPGPR